MSSSGELAEFLAWATRRAGVTPRQSEAVALLLIDGYSHAAIGAAMGFTGPYAAHQAAKLCRTALRCLSVQEWEPHEVSYWERMMETLTGDETVRAHALALMAAMRNSQDPTPRACVEDELGRPVARRDPLVSLEQHEAIVRATPTRPGAAKSSGQSAPMPR